MTNLNVIPWAIFTIIVLFLIYDETKARKCPGLREWNTQTRQCEYSQDKADKVSDERAKETRRKHGFRSPSESKM